MELHVEFISGTSQLGSKLMIPICTMAHEPKMADNGVLVGDKGNR